MGCDFGNMEGLIMAEQSYQYSIANDFPDGAVNIVNLESEIRESDIITALDRIVVSEDNIYIIFKDTLSTNDKTTLDGDATNPASGLILSHNNDDDASIIQEVEIMEENIKTGGHYQAQGVKIEIPQGSGIITNKDVSFPHPVSIMAAEWNNKPEIDGDEISFVVGPDTIVGSLTATAASGQETFNVSSTVTDNVEIGYFLKLYNGINGQHEWGRIITIDKEANTVQIQYPPTQDFLASTPTYVQMEVHLLSSCYLSGEGRVQLGEAKIGGSYLPANTIIRTKYKNNGGQKKNLVFMIEYLY